MERLHYVGLVLGEYVFKGYFLICVVWEFRNTRAFGSKTMSEEASDPDWDEYSMDHLCIYKCSLSLLSGSSSQLITAYSSGRGSRYMYYLGYMEGLVFH